MTIGEINGSENEIHNTKMHFLILLAAIMGEAMVEVGTMMEDGTRGRWRRDGERRRRMAE